MSETSSGTFGSRFYSLESWPGTSSLSDQSKQGNSGEKRPTSATSGDNNAPGIFTLGILIDAGIKNAKDFSKCLA
jgi:hypothetical protein